MIRQFSVWTCCVVCVCVEGACSCVRVRVVVSCVVFGLCRGVWCMRCRCRAWVQCVWRSVVPWFIVVFVMCCVRVVCVGVCVSVCVSVCGVCSVVLCVLCVVWCCVCCVCCVCCMCCMCCVLCCVLVCVWCGVCCGVARWKPRVCIQNVSVCAFKTYPCVPATCPHV